VVLLPGCGESPTPGGASIAVSDPKLVELNNRGVGLMGKFAYDEALAVFDELAAKHPHWSEVQINRAIATLNRQHEGDEAAALKILDAVLAIDPQDLRAHYNSGLLRLYLESPGEAMNHFQLVAETDPKDAFAAYASGEAVHR
jgi:tetratricopeptide (TPR) repeat protein